MRQASLKFKNYASAIQIVDNSDLGEKAFRFILVSFGILALFYVVILGNITFNIIERRSYEAEARNLSNEVQELELTYLKMSEKVDPILARDMGFKEAEESITARKSLGYRPTGEPLGSAKNSANGF